MDYIEIIGMMYYGDLTQMEILTRMVRSQQNIAKKLKKI